MRQVMVVRRKERSCQSRCMLWGGGAAARHMAARHVVVGAGRKACGSEAHGSGDYRAWSQLTGQIFKM